MSDIDFQNGFLCGMATKGLVRSGEQYAPLIWNDSGVYGYFYIDFRRAMEDFSLGMWNESIVVHDSVQLAVTGVSAKMTENPHVPIGHKFELSSSSLIDAILTDAIRLDSDGEYVPPQDAFAIAATALSQYNATFSPDKAIDKNVTTRWASINKNGDQYIQFDFGSLKTITQIKVMCGAAYAPESFDVYASADGISFSLVGSNRTISQADIMVPLEITPTQCRYVKLVMLSTASANFYEIKEFSAITGEQSQKYAMRGMAMFSLPDLQTITDYASSKISWTANEPTGTSVKVYAAISTATPVDTDYVECTNLSGIAGIAHHANLSGKALYIKAVLETTDPYTTPSLSGLSIEMTDEKYNSFAPIAETGIYKVSCDIQNKKSGITVLNKKTSRLRFASGERLPVFSVHMFIAGQASNIDGGYFYEKMNFAQPNRVCTESVAALMYPPVEVGSSLETIAFALPTMTASETATITLT